MTPEQSEELKVPSLESDIQSLKFTVNLICNTLPDTPIRAHCVTLLGAAMKYMPPETTATVAYTEVKRVAAELPDLGESDPRRWLAGTAAAVIEICSSLLDRQSSRLEQQAVDCPDFRWLRGMSNTQGGMVYAGQEDRDSLVRWAARRGISDFVNIEDDDFPDLRDAATLGCMLDHVRETTGCALYTRWDPALSVWVLDGHPFGIEVVGAEESDVLVRALVLGWLALGLT